MRASSRGHNPMQMLNPKANPANTAPRSSMWLIDPYTAGRWGLSCSNLCFNISVAALPVSPVIEQRLRRLKTAYSNKVERGSRLSTVVASYCATFLKPEMLHIYRQIPGSNGCVRF